MSRAAARRLARRIRHSFSLAIAVMPNRFHGRQLINEGEDFRLWGLTWFRGSDGEADGTIERSESSIMKPRREEVDAVARDEVHKSVFVGEAAGTSSRPGDA